MKSSLLLLVLSLTSQVYSFTLSSIPSNIIVKQQFSVDWSSQEGDPPNVNVLVFDANRTPACSATEGSHYELSQVVSVSSGQGSVPFTVPHSGKYIMCAFNFTNSSEPSRSITGTSYFNSSIILAALQMQTVTVTAESGQQTGDTTSSSSNNDGAIIGGALGGFLALLLAIVLALFWFGRYRIVREDDPRVGDSKYSDHVEEDAGRARTGYLPYDGRATSTVESSSLYPSSRPTNYQSGTSERGWGSHSGPSEVAEETPPSYASVSGVGA